MRILTLILMTLLFCTTAQAAQLMEECSSETTGLKYTDVEGSGFASMFFIIPLLALSPVAGATDTTGQYRCHVAVIGADAIGAKRKIKKFKERPQVEPY